MDKDKIATLENDGGQAPPDAWSDKKDKGEATFSRRQAIGAIGGAAVAAVGIGAMALFGLNRNEQKDTVALSAEITNREAKPVGVAYACAPADLDRIETCGIGANNVSCLSPETAAAVAAAHASMAFEAPVPTSEEEGDGKSESPEHAVEDAAAPEGATGGGHDEETQATESSLQADSPAGDAARYLTYRFKDLVPGKPYLFKADIMEPTYAKVEDRASYPKGWRFAKEDSTGAYMIASASKADETSAVVVPSSPSGHVSCALPCVGDGSYALANMTLLGVV